MTVASAADLRASRCRHTTAEVDAAEAQRLLVLLDGWRIDAGHLVRTFAFRDYYQTMAFVNALAYVAHTQDHHPELTVGYRTCAVRYRTHSAQGLSLNDFICAAQADALLPTERA